eukprot:scaffold4686_cov230-Pinguiococcus_pyrenoidosus.AAC.5
MPPPAFPQRRLYGHHARCRRGHILWRPDRSVHREARRLGGQGVGAGPAIAAPIELCLQSSHRLHQEPGLVHHPEARRRSPRVRRH